MIHKEGMQDAESNDDNGMQDGNAKGVAIRSQNISAPTPAEGQVLKFKMSHLGFISKRHIL